MLNQHERLRALCSARVPRQVDSELAHLKATAGADCRISLAEFQIFMLWLLERAPDPIVLKALERCAQLVCHGRNLKALACSCCWSLPSS